MSLLFENGRKLLKDQKYEAAKENFLHIYMGEEIALQPMAGLYAGICLYYQGAYEEALEQFEEVKASYEAFPLQDPLKYWQGRAYIKQKDILAAMAQFESLHSQRYKLMADSCVSTFFEGVYPRVSNLPLLAKAYEISLVSSIIRSKLQEALLRHVPPGEEDTIDSLFEQQETRKNAHHLLTQARLETKEYQVAVLLPFFFKEQLLRSPSDREHSFVWSLYQGMCSAKKQLEAQHIRLQLHPYDTRRNLPTTLGILDSLKGKKIHLIVGPLYWETIVAVQAFASENDVPMLNPLSSNNRINGRRGGWLFQPSDLTQTLAAIEYAKQQFSHRVVAIFCENIPRMVSSCELYARGLRSAGFEVLIERYLPKEESVQIQEQLCAVNKTQMDLSADSIPEPEEGYIFKKGIGKYGEQSEQWYKEQWNIQPNDIGHVFVMAQDPSFLSYLTGAIEQRPDTIPVITQSHWLDRSEFDYAQFERLGLRFISSPHIPLASTSTSLLKDSFLEQWGEFPTRYAYIGYELTWIMGQAMRQYGDNFMYMLQQSSQIQRGTLGFDLQYRPQRRDNQLVSILQIQDGQLRLRYTYGREEIPTE